MKYSASIRYGGLLVDALDCDETSFKSLGLICPECSKTVYWMRETKRSGYTIKKSGKEVEATTVASHFSHFPVPGNENEGGECEARVKSYGKPNLQQSEKKAFVQRKQELETRIFQMFGFNKFLGINTGSVLSAGVYDFKQFLIDKKFPANHLTKYQKFHARQFRAKKLYAKKLIEESVTNDSIQNKLHKQVCGEVLDYIYQSSNSKLLEDFVTTCLWLVLLAEEQGEDVLEVDVFKLFKSGYMLCQEVFKDNLHLHSSNNGTYINSETLDKAIAFLVKKIIIGTDWSEAFSFFDRSNKNSYREIKKLPPLRMCNVFLKSSEMEDCMSVFRIPDQDGFSYFDFLKPILTIEDVLNHSVFSFRPEFMNDGERVFFRDQGKNIDNIFLVTTAFVHRNDHYEGFRFDALMIQKKGFIENLPAGTTRIKGLAAKVFFEEADPLISGFGFTNLHSIFEKNKCGFARRFKKVCPIKDKEKLLKIVSRAGVVVEDCWTESCYGIFITSLSEYLLKTVSYGVANE